MLYYCPILLSIFSHYRRCPRCKRAQHFKGKKKGDTVHCKKCGHEFVLR
ncbi:hypothetical protein A45J_0752 [hot springs metagenome]|uniref:Uncharacterized protein n=1 Tax=hot springs metagenome TaxID=433727 RepID=A0A5J4L2H4_9ZZZZ